MSIDSETAEALTKKAVPETRHGLVKRRALLLAQTVEAAAASGDRERQLVATVHLHGRAAHLRPNDGALETWGLFEHEGVPATRRPRYDHVGTLPNDLQRIGP